jgi:hypothetical protein
MLHAAVQRRALRRSVYTSCQAVDTAEFCLLGEQVIDLSPRGMFIACDRRARVGDDIVVSFRAPGREELWLDAEAVVARIVEGQRWGDLGYGAGLEFTYFEKAARHELLARVAGFPPPIPQRRLRTARDRQSARDAVWIRPIMSVGIERRAPRGVFC